MKRISRKFITSKKIPIFFLGLLITVFVQIPASGAENLLLNKDGNWSTEGANGKVYVYGSLTESACSLSMSSAYQAVSLGNIETADFRSPGDKGIPVPINFILTDCTDTSSRIQNNRSGNQTWDSVQPGVKIKFLASTDEFSPILAKVEGAKGIGLQLSDTQGEYLHFGEYNNPQLIISNQEEILTYYVTPVRTTNELQPGVFFSTIAFSLSYD